MNTKFTYFTLKSLAETFLSVPFDSTSVAYFSPLIFPASRISILLSRSYILASVKDCCIEDWGGCLCKGWGKEAFCFDLFKTTYLFPTLFPPPQETSEKFLEVKKVDWYQRVALVLHI